MSDNDLILGLEDAAKCCEAQEPFTKRVIQAHGPPQPTPETIAMRRASEACREAMRRLTPRPDVEFHPGPIYLQEP